MKGTFVILFIIINWSIYAQNYITAKIVDTDNEPIPYVSVFLDNQIKTISNSDGVFTIDYKTVDNDVEFQSLNIKTIKVTIKEIKSNNLIVKLPLISTQIEEVVIKPANPRLLLKESLQKLNELLKQNYKVYTKIFEVNNDTLYRFNELSFNIENYSGANRRICPQTLFYSYKSDKKPSKIFNIVGLPLIWDIYNYDDHRKFSFSTYNKGNETYFKYLLLPKGEKEFPIEITINVPSGTITEIKNIDNHSVKTASLNLKSDSWMTMSFTKEGDSIVLSKRVINYNFDVAYKKGIRSIKYSNHSEQIFIPDNNSYYCTYNNLRLDEIIPLLSGGNVEKFPIDRSEYEIKLIDKSKTIR